MEDHVCLYFKYGYCKYKNKCKREHMKEACEDLNHCMDQRICNKRHPRVCKIYVEDRVCRFRSDCAYHHPLEKEELTFEINDLKEKVDTLKLIVYLLADKIENLEFEMHKIKGVETFEDVFEEKSQKEENKKKGNQEKKVQEPNKKDKILHPRKIFKEMRSKH